ncbi:MAG: phosphate ABC transporter substrate-binding protein [Promicromonosporaceae bacterium]|nr:phosphate ABC transporter substrate-binding protein [Promicromonosporaceae bacterium]
MKKKTARRLAPALALTIALTAAACGGNGDGDQAGDGLSGNVLLNGSTSVERVIAALAEQFMIDHDDINVTFNPTGSGAGITSAQEGTADIGLTSRALRDGEDGVNATTFAIDGLAVIIHPGNPVQNLTLEQLYGIYSGTITNWRELGGNDQIIAPIGREAGSGSRSVFDDVVGVAEPAHAQELTSGGAVITAVATNPGAIGYASLSAINDTVTAISVDGVEISNETLVNGSYPVARPFILLTQEGTTPSPAAQAFLDFVLSPAATEIIYNAGVVQVN